MKRARVIWQGREHSATASESGGLRLADGTPLRDDQVRWLPPLTPRGIVTLDLQQPTTGGPPFVMLKGPNTLTGHRTPVPHPPGTTALRAECKLAILIGIGGKRITRASAFEHVAGYMVATDCTVLDGFDTGRHPSLRAKNRDACTPIGPWLVDAADVPDPLNLRLSTRLNGSIVRHGSTREPFGIAELIETLSDFMTLSTGDIILAGLPTDGADCAIGDEVVAEIEGIGRLVNSIGEPA